VCLDCHVLVHCLEESTVRQVAAQRLNQLWGWPLSCRGVSYGARAACKLCCTVCCTFQSACTAGQSLILDDPTVLPLVSPPCCLLQCAMFLGWITGMHPPGKTLACFSAGKVVMHKLQVRQQRHPGSKSGSFCLVLIFVPVCCCRGYASATSHNKQPAACRPRAFSMTMQAQVG
jgi:hypothetical protein